MKRTLATLLMIAAAPAFAGQSHDVSGTSVGQSENTYIPASETLIYIDLKTTYALPENDTPLAGMIGECVGFMTIMVGSGANGTGVCVWTDGDGDTWHGPWDVKGMGADGASVGQWHATGGTGKFEGVTGGGTFSSLTNPENGESKLDVMGSVTMK